MENQVFTVLMFSTTLLVMSAMYVMPLLTFERCFATYYLGDYETNERRYISFFLISVVFFIGFASSIACLNESNTVYVIGLLVIFNAISLVLNLFVHFYNKRQYQTYHGSQENLERSVTYSLTTRFQISENLKSIHVLNVIIVYMGLMNCLVVGSLVVCSMHIGPKNQAICSFVLEFCIFLYSHSFPQIMICYGDQFRKKVYESFSKIGVRLSKNKVLPLRNTFGTRMDECSNIDDHFLNLKSSWDSAAPKTK